jgi:hypothetical protein
MAVHNTRQVSAGFTGGAVSAGLPIVGEAKKTGVNEDWRSA